MQPLFHVPKPMQGAVLVELALVAPIFLMMLFALIEIGWMLHTRTTIAAAAREGARILTLPGNHRLEAEQFSITYLDQMGYDAAIFHVSATDHDPNCLKLSSDVSMHIQVPFSAISLTGDPFALLSRHIPLQATVIMRKECLRN